jgi:hypothetical protein
MKCPNCKNSELNTVETLSGIIWNRKKVVTVYCILCDFENVKEFKLNEDSYQAELTKKKKTNYFETKREIMNG